MKKKYTFYAYNSPTSGTFFDDDDVYYYAEDFRTVKKYREYKNAGFDYLLLQHENSYSGERFEGSACQKCMRNAAKAGIKKVIVSDTRLKALCDEENLLGEGGKFSSEEELLSYLKICLSPYVSEPNFFGVQLKDEPFFQALKSYGIVCRALKKILPEIYLQCNINPIAELRFYTDDASANIYEAYEGYLHDFLNQTGMDSILFDNYPFRRGYIMYAYYIQTYQIAARVCRDCGVELRTVMQSFCGYNLGRIAYRAITERDMYWQMNFNLGFGSKELSFFTYMTKQEMRGSKKGGLVTDGIDGGAFVNRDGTRTKLYYYSKRIIREVKRFSKYLYDARYEDNYVLFEEGKSFRDYDLTDYGIEEKPAPFPVKFTNGPLLITELKRKHSTVFMIENIGNIVEEYRGKKPMKVEVDFKTEKIKVRSLANRVKLDTVGGKVSCILPCGEAIFVEIKQ